MDSVAHIHREIFKTKIKDNQETALLIILTAAIASLPIIYLITLLYHWFQNWKKTKTQELFDPPPRYCEEQPPPSYDEAVKIEMETIKC